MSEAEREQTAKEIIAELAAEWHSNEFTYSLKEGDAYTFTFILARHGGATVVSYNPFEEVKRLVFTIDLQLGDSEDSGTIHRSAKRCARHMLDIARQHFEDSLQQLEVIAKTRVDLIFSQAFGGPEYLKRLIDNAAELLDGQLRDRLGEVLIDDLKGPHSKFTDGEAQVAIHQLGGRPSRRALARKLGVTPATVLNWARRRGFKDLDELLNHLAAMRAEIEKDE